MKNRKYSVSKNSEDVVKVLSFFNAQSEELGVTELSKMIGYSPSKIHRILRALVEGLLLETNPVTHRYRLGVKAFELGMFYLHHHPLRKIVRPHAELLAKRVQANVSFAVLHKRSAIILDRVQALDASAIFQRVSFNVSLHCTALGKALLAYSPKKERDLLIDALSFTKNTAQTITDKGELRAELKKVCERGYSLDLGETYPNVTCVGSPIYNENGEVVAALSVSDLKDKMDNDRISNIVPILKETTGFISRQLGY